MQIDFFYNCIAFIDCFYIHHCFSFFLFPGQPKVFRTLPRRDCPDPAYHLTGSVMEVAYSCESLVLPLSETHFFTIHIISIPSDVFIVHTQQFICDFCRYRTFSMSIALLFILSIFVNSTYTVYFTVVSQLF